MASVGPAGTSAYNEDEIVDLILGIYWALRRLGHFDAEDYVTDAPMPAGHVLDLSGLQEDTKIDPRVVSLMKRLPAAPASSQTKITDKQIAWDCTSAHELAWSRDIASRHGSRWGRTLDTSTSRPTDLILFEQYEADCGVVILNVEENTIRLFKDELPAAHPLIRASASQEERIQHSQDYKNFPTTPAPAYLRDMLDKYLRAEMLPNFEGDIYPVDYGPGGWFSGANVSYAAGLRELQRMLLEEYKWPGEDFRADDWKRDGPGLVNAAFWPPALEPRR